MASLSRKRTIRSCLSSRLPTAISTLLQLQVHLSLLTPSRLFSSVPGNFLVDVFPFLRHIPAWCPGANFKRLAAKWRQAFDDMVEVPYAHTKKLMVLFFLLLLLLTLTLFSFLNRLLVLAPIRSLAPPSSTKRSFRRMKSLTLSIRLPPFTVVSRLCSS
jgi:hypothetical protein